MLGKNPLKILKRGPDAWNRWRRRQREIVLDFGEEDLHGVNLRGADLSDVLLMMTVLSDADLTRADLSGALLYRAELGGAKLSHARLIDANFTGADLGDADLHRAFLPGATLSGADLSGTKFMGANLTGADLSEGLLLNADLGGADLRYANLSSANMTGTKISGAIFGNTVLDDIDLRTVEGLTSVEHFQPSALSINTIYRSEGQIPEVFLRGCGVPESFIVQIPALVAAVQPIQFYSCFISYSSKDQGFAERLHADLQSRGVRVWFAPHDMKIGARIRPTIDEFIRVFDKLLLVLSENSVSSQWVEQEVETALRKESRPGGGAVLFPVRLDDSVLGIDDGWPAFLKDTRHIGDFTRWKAHDAYRVAFERLLRDLKAQA